MTLGGPAQKDRNTGEAHSTVDTSELAFGSTPLVVHVALEVCVWASREDTLAVAQPLVLIERSVGQPTVPLSTQNWALALVHLQSQHHSMVEMQYGEAQCSWVRRPYSREDEGTGIPP